MAQSIQIPAELQFSSRPLRWHRGKATFEGWVDEYYGGPVGVVKVREPERYKGITQKILPERLSVEVAALIPEKPPKRFSRKLHRIPAPIALDILLSDWPDGSDYGENYKPCVIDAWQMREDFLRLPSDLDALLAFLNKYGEWGEKTSPQYRGEKDDERPRAEIVFPEEILFVDDRRKHVERLGELLKLPNPRVPLQDVIRWALTNTASAWFRTSFFALPLHGPIPDFPHFVIEAKNCYDSLFASVTIDHLRGAEFRVCARPDCGNLFKLTSKHRKLYCDTPCAHLESVRKQRREAASQRLKAATKKGAK